MRLSKKSVNMCRGASTTWCSTHRAMTSAGSWSCLKKISRPGCDGSPERPTVATGPSSIYIAAPEPETGKSTIALGILHGLSATVAKIGVFRPITRVSQDADPDRDYILELLLQHTTVDLPYEQCIGVTYQQLHADKDAAIAMIVDSYQAMAEACDVVVIVGTDYTDITSPAELSINARIAVNLGAPVLLAVNAQRRTAERGRRTSSMSAWLSCPPSAPTPLR